MALEIGSYIVAAVYAEDTADLQANIPAMDLSTAPGITYIEPRYGSCCFTVTLPFPGQSLQGGFGLLGGTLMVDAGDNLVPEPAGYALALSALSALAISRRRSVRVTGGPGVASVEVKRCSASAKISTRTWKKRCSAPPTF